MQGQIGDTTSVCTHRHARPRRASSSSACARAWAGFAVAIAFAGGMARAQHHAASLENSSYLTTTNTGGLNPQRFTIEAWIRPDGPGYGNTGDGGGASILNKPRQGAAGNFLSSWLLFRAESTQRVGFLIGHTSPNVGTVVVSNTLVPTGTTVHVAGTFDGVTARLYINGVLDNSGPAVASSVFYFATDPVLIGAGNYCCGFLRRWQGLVDDVRIWSVVRSDAEIAASAACGFNPGTPATLLAHWTFDGMSVNDVSGNGRHATFQAGNPAYAPGIAGGSPTIRRPPANQTICRSGRATFTVQPSGFGPLTYQWRLAGVPINAAGNPSAATAMLVISNAQASDQGAYDCVVTNSCDSVTSAAAMLTICVADTDDGSGTGTCDGGVTIDDLLYYLELFTGGLVRGDVDDGSGTGTPDGGVTIDDLLYLLFRFEAGC